MSERIRKEPAYPDYGARNLDYFFGGPDDIEQRKEFEDRGLIPTNNLSLYIVDDPTPELAPGISNRHDYRQRSFGPIIENLRLTEPELWEQAKESIAESGRIMSEYGDLLWSGQTDAAVALEEIADETTWAKRVLCDKIFRIIAPELKAAGIDPVDVCI